MNQSIYELFLEDLYNDEKILWVDRPKDVRVFTFSDIFHIPFSIIIFIISFMWEFLAIFGRAEKGSIEVVFPFLGIPFILVGLYLLFGRFILKFWKNSHTYYAITDKRILILTRMCRKHLKATNLNSITSINKSVNSRGSGNISFGDPSLYSRLYANTGLDFLGEFQGNNVLSFYGIKDIEKVYQLIYEILQKNTKVR